ncbi:MAG TPA: SMC-Scp complex subunit ScpB [Chloroflexi bacterium]|nr:SMC-Scp complex subunit ScpB [Chloroflexota bacterium]
MSPAQTPLSLEARLEALLFAAPEPVTVRRLAQALGISLAETEAALQRLESALQTRGIRLQRHRDRWQLTTAPELGTLVADFLGLEATHRLSRAALETLAIIAYRQPVTRPQVDAIRGVSSDGVLRSLLNKGLIEEVGRSEGPGRPILYGTTALFLETFGLPSLAALPSLEDETAPPEPTTPVLKD